MNFVNHPGFDITTLKKSMQSEIYAVSAL